jgi:phage terminase large subunit-like protein
MINQQFVFKLHPGQSAIYNSRKRFKVCAAGRRFGKSHIAAILLGQAAMETERLMSDGTVKPLTAEHFVYYVAPTFEQGKRIMWPKLRSLLRFERNGGLIRNENTNDGWIELTSGRRIYIKGADNPDTLRGTAVSFVVLDEYADMKAFVWDEILSDQLSDVEGSALFIGTPKGKNHFYKLFMNALQQPVNKVTGAKDDWEDWESFHFESMDNPFLTESEKRRMQGGNRTLETIAQEVKASFISGGGKILRPDWFDIVDEAPPTDEGFVFITVDLAGFKKDEASKNKIVRTDHSVIAEVLEIQDVWYVLNVQFGHWDVRETAQKIVLTTRRYYSARLGIEKGALANAVGPYLEDYMRAYGRYVTPQPLTHGNQRKQDRISWALEGRAQRRRIKLVRGTWNEAFLSEVADFPDPLAKDDIIDAVAYVDQMARAVYSNDLPEQDWQPEDIDIGF